ncbi:hypothetical protein FXB38_25255 [Bradyrhizobium cytisi]|uniref:Uncharacterized protein n=1 Tax=Bradyrhizobium cytisi TaxID=515489 RepID=A0A5S4WDD6_9BRAD|nr:hypothetical protein FXB38_25255 [Bradyrhizobium cytisi]
MVGPSWRAISPSSLRAQRSNPESFCGDSLDCFAALAMTSSVERASLYPRHPEVAASSAAREGRRPRWNRIFALAVVTSKGLHET